MKRFFILAASIGLLAACSGLEQPEPDLFLDMDGDLVEKVVFEVLPIKDGDNPETRASAVPNGGSVGFVWEATDTVGIYPGRGSQVYFNIEDGVGSNSVSFTGGDWALKQNATYTSYYPFVGDIYLKRDKIPVSFAGQKQIGTTSPFIGARYFLATESTSSENGVLRFSYSTLNTIINVNATLPAGTYTKATMTVSEPLFVEEGFYSLEERTIVGKTYSNTLMIDLEGVTLTEQGVLPVYFMSAPVNLKNKDVTVNIFSSNGQKYEWVKTPSKEYAAGTRYGLTCEMIETPTIDNSFDYDLSNLVIVNNPTKGGLEDVLMELGNYESFSSLKVTGTMNDVDFLVIYRDMPNLRYLDISDIDNTSLPTKAFYKSTNVTHLILPKTLTVIGDSMFYQSGLIAIKLQDNLKAIGDSAFEECDSLMSLDVPASVEIIGKSAFRNCTLLASVNFEKGSQLKTIDGDTYRGAFYGCTLLDSIVIPASVETIGSSAFRECTSLTSVFFENNSKLKIISGGVSSSSSYPSYYGAFYGCTLLDSIMIPASVETIGSNAFRECTSLASVTFERGSQLKIIDRDVFYGCRSLFSIEIPNCVESIERGAFLGCTLLASVSFEKGSHLKTIGGYSNNGAFYECQSLGAIEIPESVETIGYSAFNRCTSLISVTFERGSQLKIIDLYAFSGCISLLSIEIPASVEKIRRGAFSACVSLVSVTFEKGSRLQAIGEGGINDGWTGAFSDCNSLASIVIPASVNSIGAAAFCHCESLTSASFEENSLLEKLESKVFRFCSSLQKVTFAKGSLLTKIVSDAFEGCSKLRTVDASGCSQLSEIEDMVFKDLGSLRLFYCGAETPPTVGSSTFSGIDPYAVLKVPDESVDSYKSATRWSSHFQQISGFSD